MSEVKHLKKRPKRTAKNCFENVFCYFRLLSTACTMLVPRTWQVSNVLPNEFLKCRLSKKLLSYTICNIQLVHCVTCYIQYGQVFDNKLKPGQYQNIARVTQSGSPRTALFQNHTERDTKNCGQLKFQPRRMEVIFFTPWRKLSKRESMEKVQTLFISSSQIQM